MNILSQLYSVLSGLDIPIETGVFKDEAPDRYIVIVPMVDSFDLHADNTPIIDVQEVRLSLYSNLHSIVEAKGSLIRKALGAANLPIEISDHKVSFPWFQADPTPDELKAYESFVCRLCDMARNQKRVTAKEKETDNEKYAFRCFLLRLGFIGDEFKAARKILLRNFSGSSAFKTAPSAKEVQS